MVWRVRRVVTGLNADGRSTVLFDGIAENVKEMESMPGLALTDLWETRESPTDNGAKADAATRPVHLAPPPNGSIFRIVEFPPDTQWRDKADGSTAFSSIGAGGAHKGGAADPMMHKTDTIDYLVVLQGEMHAVLEETEVLLKPGDVFVQRGTVHSWSVRGANPCVIAAILIDAKPV